MTLIMTNIITTLSNITIKIGLTSLRIISTIKPSLMTISTIRLSPIKLSIMTLIMTNSIITLSNMAFCHLDILSTRYVVN